MQWWYEHDEAARGPVIEAELMRLFEDGRIGEDTLIWKEGMEKWMRFAEVFPPGTRSSGSSVALEPEQAQEEVPQILSPPPPIRTPFHQERIRPGIPEKVEFRLGQAMNEASRLLFRRDSILVWVFPFLFATFLVGAGCLGGCTMVAIPVLSSVLVAGIQFYLLLKLRNEYAEISDLFIGFRRNFLHLLLHGVFMTASVITCGLFGLLLYILQNWDWSTGFSFNVFDHLKSEPSQSSAVSSLIAGAIPCGYLIYATSLSIPLLVDRRLKFSAAMRDSLLATHRFYRPFLSLFLLATGITIGIAGICYWVSRAVTESEPAIWGGGLALAGAIWFLVGVTLLSLYNQLVRQLE